MRKVNAQFIVKLFSFPFNQELQVHFLFVPTHFPLYDFSLIKLDLCALLIGSAFCVTQTVAFEVNHEILCGL